jgi:DNA-binding NarL/FixJ family response regulator
VLDGLQVLEQLPSPDGPPHVIVLLAGPESAERGRRALALGALGYLLKPIDVGVLGRSVAEVLDLGTDDDRSAYRQRSLQGLDGLH